MKIRTRQYANGTVSYQLDCGMVTSATGAKRRKFLQFKTKEEAKAARVKELALKREEGESGLAISSRERAHYAACAARLAGVGASIGEAVDFYLKHHSGIKERLSLETLIDRFLLDKAGTNKRPHYLAQLKCSTKSFKLAGHAGKRVDEVTEEDVTQWLRSNGWAPKTQRVYLTDLTTLFAWAIKRHYAMFNPCTAVETPALDDIAPGILSVAETRSLLEAALRHDSEYNLCAYFVVGIFTGVRPHEIARIGWSAVHLEDRFIEVQGPKAKSRKRRIVHISENAAAWLAASQCSITEKLVPPNFSKRFIKIRKLAKLTRWPHDALRHCFASYHLAAHGSAEKTSEQLGHEDTQMLYKHYRELVRPKDASAFWEILPP